MNKKIIQSADRSARYMDQFPWVDQLAERFMERFDWFKFKPKTILCLGATSSTVIADLTERFPQAQLYLLDVSLARMQAVTASIPGRITQIQITSPSLPLANQSVDLIVSHCWLQWCSLPKLIPELFRVLKVNGLLMFTTLGADSLREIKECWAFDVGYHHVNEFVDMHDIGDLLLTHRFIDPVMDMELLQVQYRDVKQIIRDLKQLGSCNIHAYRPLGLIGKNRFNGFLAAYQQLADAQQALPLSWEIIYGHAWMPEQILFAAQSNQEVVIPLNAIGKAKPAKNHDESDNQ